MTFFLSNITLQKMVSILICCVFSAGNMWNLLIILYGNVRSLERFGLGLLKMIFMCFGMSGLNGATMIVGIGFFIVLHL